MKTLADKQDRRRHDFMTEERRLRVRKLRWMGLDEEADRLNTLSDTPPSITLPPETD